MTNIQEALFQLTNTNDKTKLDLKKIGLIINELHKKTDLKPSEDTENPVTLETSKLINQLNLGFAQIHTKAIRNEKQFKQLEQLTKESLVATKQLSQQIKEAAKCGPETTQSEIVSRLRTELAQLKQHCDYQQAAYDGLEKQKVLEA